MSDDQEAAISDSVPDAVQDAVPQADAVPDADDDAQPGRRGSWLDGCGCDPFTGMDLSACCDLSFCDAGDCCTLTSLLTFLASANGLVATVAGTNALGRRLKQDPQSPGTALAAALHRGVRFYQLRISARRTNYGSCRYTPTCSAFAAEAIREHGAIRGVRLAVSRLRRCKPHSAGGADPVPFRYQTARPRV